MNFSHRIDPSPASGAALIVDIRASLNSETAPAALAYLRQLLEQNLASIHAVILNVQEMPSISSAGLRIFFLMAKQGVRLIVCGANPTVREVFDFSGLSSILPIYEDVDTALKHSSLRQ